VDEEISHIVMTREGERSITNILKIDYKAVVNLKVLFVATCNTCVSMGYLQAHNIYWNMCYMFALGWTHLIDWCRQDGL